MRWSVPGEWVVMKHIFNPIEGTKAILSLEGRAEEGVLEKGIVEEAVEGPERPRPPKHAR